MPSESRTTLRNAVFVPLLLALVITTDSAPLAWTYTTGNYTWAVAVSEDGRYVISGSDDMHAYFFESASGKLLWSYAMDGYVRNVAISENGTYSAAGDAAGNVVVFRLGSSGEPICRLASGSPIDALALTRNGGYLAIGDRSGNLQLFSNGAACLLKNRYLLPSGVLSLSLSEPSVLAAASTRGGLYYFGGSSDVSPLWIFGDATTFPEMAIVRETGYIISGGTDGYAYVIDKSGRMVDRQRVGAAVASLSVAEATNQVAFGSVNGTLILYAIREGLTKVSALEFGQPIVSVEMSDRGERVSTACLDGEISMYDQSLTKSLWMFSAGSIVHSVSISGDGVVTAAASDSGSIYLFNEKILPREASTIVDPAVVSAFCVLAVVAVGGYFIVRRRRKASSE